MSVVKEETQLMSFRVVGEMMVSGIRLKYLIFDSEGVAGDAPSGAATSLIATENISKPLTRAIARVSPTALFNKINKSKR